MHSLIRPNSLVHRTVEVRGSLVLNGVDVAAALQATQTSTPTTTTTDTRDILALRHEIRLTDATLVHVLAETASNKQSIQTNQNNISANASSVTTAQVTASNALTQAASNAFTLANTISAMSTNTAAIDTLDQNLHALSHEVRLTDAALVDVLADTASNTQSIQTNQNNILANASSVATAQATASANTVDIDTLHRNMHALRHESYADLQREKASLVAMDSSLYNLYLSFNSTFTTRANTADANILALQTETATNSTEASILRQELARVEAKIAGSTGGGTGGGTITVDTTFGSQSSPVGVTIEVGSSKFLKIDTGQDPSNASVDIGLQIGNVTGLLPQVPGIAHVGFCNIFDYALLQSTTGATMLNAPASQSLRLKKGGFDSLVCDSNNVWTFSAGTKVAFAAGVAMSGTFSCEDKIATTLVDPANSSSVQGLTIDTGTVAGAYYDYYANGFNVRFKRALKLEMSHFASTSKVGPSWSISGGAPSSGNNEVWVDFSPSSTSDYLMFGWNDPNTNTASTTSGWHNIWMVATAVSVFGTLNVNGNVNYTGSLTNISDQRIKTNMSAANTADAYAATSQIQLHQYDYMDTSRPRTRWGFIAQQVEEVVPEAVTTTSGDFDATGKQLQYSEETPAFQDRKQVDKTRLFQLLFAAFQEAQNKISALEARVAALESQ